MLCGTLRSAKGAASPSSRQAASETPASVVTAIGSDRPAKAPTVMAPSTQVPRRRTEMIAAGSAGILIPLTLDRLKVDPAIASSVFVTMITDVVGFFAFLGLAGLWFGLF